ncbi:hypothetical protein M9458_051808, partial [Cirrhinus mrigala]
ACEDMPLSTLHSKVVFFMKKPRLTSTASRSGPPTSRKALPGKSPQAARPLCSPVELPDDFDSSSQYGPGLLFGASAGEEKVTAASEGGREPSDAEALPSQWRTQKWRPCSNGQPKRSGWSGILHLALNALGWMTGSWVMTVTPAHTRPQCLCSRNQDEEFVQQVTGVKKQTEAIKHILPRQGQQPACSATAQQAGPAARPAQHLSTGFKEPLSGFKAGEGPVDLPGSTLDEGTRLHPGCLPPVRRLPHAFLALHKILNRALHRFLFKTLTLKHCVRDQDCFVAIDLKDAYFHYKVLPFGLSLSLRVFMKVAEAALAPLREVGIRILNYLDWLILAHSKLSPVQSIFFLGVELDSVAMTVRLSQDRAQALKLRTATPKYF